MKTAAHSGVCSKNILPCHRGNTGISSVSVKIKIPETQIDKQEPPKQDKPDTIE